MRTLRTLSFLAATAATLVTVLPATAHADQTVSSGTLTISSQPGDITGNGGTYSYGTATGTRFTVTSWNGGSDLGILVEDSTGWWSIGFSAPAGQRVTTGSYTFQSQVERPVVSVGGSFGSGCDASGGANITEATYDAAGQIDRFAATFTQQCLMATAGLTGAVAFDANPLGPPLTVTQKLAAIDAVSAGGTTTISGTLACSKNVSPQLAVTVTQKQGRNTVSAVTAERVWCGPAGTLPWSIAVASGVTFKPGPAKVSVVTSAGDPDTFQLVEVTNARNILLKRR